MSRDAALGASDGPLLTPAQFAEFRLLIREHTGISLGDGKGQMVERRLSGRVRALGLDGFDSYLEVLRHGDAAELEEFVNAVTTNLTSFFRENHHFEFLAGLLAERRDNGGPRRLRIWSAGCSTGEEPYSIAATVRDVLGRADGWDVRILATDLDSSVLARAQAGIYPATALDRLPPSQPRHWFQRGTGPNAGSVRVKATLRDMISFRQLNLLGPWPLRGPFDVIFCRNVMIYFDKETQRTLVDRYAGVLDADCPLVIGHSESLFNVSSRFRLIGKTIYRKAA